MKLRTFKNTGDQLYYFEIKSNKLGNTFLKNSLGFNSKVDRNDFIISVLQSLSDKKLILQKEDQKSKSYFVLRNKFGKTLLESERFKKEDFSIILKELNKSLPELKKHASQKPNSNILNLYPKASDRIEKSKKEILKKDRKSKSEKTYLKKGNYHFNDIYYDIFLSGNGRHYFSFINNTGKTVLLNGDIKGFDSVEDAELIIKEVLLYAPNKKNYEIKTAKDGKFFFNLYNSKREKIAKSFFFRKREDVEASIAEFLGNLSPQKDLNIPAKEKSIPVPIIPPTQQPSINELAQKNEERKRLEAEERKKAAERERISLENKREKERLAQIEKDKKKKEAVLSAQKEKTMSTNENKGQTKEEASAVTQTSSSNNSYNDRDAFDGCFRWFGFLLLAALLILLLSYYKGCFNSGVDGNSDSDASALVDSTNIEDGAINDSLLVNSDGLKDESGNQKGNKESDSNYKGSNGGDYYSTDIEVPSCNCSEKAIVFETPDTEPKSVSRLGTNPQFGNTHGLNSADFLEELKYAAQTNSWDKKYLDYLYKAMGYKNGFADASSKQISQATINTGITGVLGFGKYSGYGYSKLDLSGKDLEVFRIEAANGCHINFMKTCGNLLFICN